MFMKIVAVVAGLAFFAVVFMLGETLVAHVATSEAILARLRAAHDDTAVLAAEIPNMSALFAAIPAMAERLLDPLIVVLGLLYLLISGNAMRNVHKVFMTLSVLALLNGSLGVQFYGVTNVETVQAASNAVEFHGYSLRLLLLAAALFCFWVTTAVVAIVFAPTQPRTH
jgi:hypothetical protein